MINGERPELSAEKIFNCNETLVNFPFILLSYKKG